jgi:16S rRNA (cytidine1402-2'-O)-methyltransferase
MLTVVPTPIGNLGDITLRALEALRKADLVAAEDTRHSGILLAHHGIKKPFLSFHEHNEASRTAELIPRMKDGLRVALITDAGMPSISDPGGRLVRACAENGVAWTVLPGPSALITALVGSGFPSRNFSFGGFLPVKSGQRHAELGRAAAGSHTVIYYESPYRLVKSLEVLAALCPERRVCVARELTKKFEEYRIGVAAELLAHYTAHPPKGEITLLLSGVE